MGPSKFHAQALDYTCELLFVIEMAIADRVPQKFDTRPFTDSFPDHLRAIIVVCGESDWKSKQVRGQ